MKSAVVKAIGMRRDVRARCAVWLQLPCPACGARPGQRCRMEPGSFQFVFHPERSTKTATPETAVTR